MMDVVVKYVEACRDDLDAARALIDANRAFYAPFLCHQALYKALRGLYLERRNSYPIAEPRLDRLADAAGAGDLVSGADREFLRELSMYPEVVEHPVYRVKLLEHAKNAGEIEKRARDLAERVVAALG
ncbi:HEPN domain-containing protein [bacterium]|nr:HEPN domain-containing protein [bacterium]